jgi:uncharacterized membrane protein YidH (DUF202 family)
MSKLITLVGIVALIVFLVAIGPLAFIWAINEFGQTLWPERQLPYTFWTWLAAAIIMAVPSVKVTKKN